MAFGQAIQYDTIRSIDSSTFSGSYQALGTPFTKPASIVKIVNNSGVLVTISTDGIHDMDVVPSNGFFLYDITTNAPHSGNTLFFPVGTQFLIKSTASIGLVYLVVLYLMVL